MSQRCRASVLHAAKDLRLEERVLEAPGPAELQITIRATGLCGSDIHYYQHFRNGDIQIREPLSLGHESAGVINAVGSQVDGFKIGDRVALEVGVPCGECQRCEEGRYNICQGMRFRSSAKAFPHFQGTLQEKINHPADWCHKLPEHFPLNLGAILEPLGVAIQASRRAKITEGGSYLVFGAGAVGLLCAAVSKTAGSSKVVIADIQQQRIEWAIEHGFADHGFVVPAKRAHNIEEKLKVAKETAELACHVRRTGSASAIEFDTVFECTGAEACTQAAIYAARPGGKVVIVGIGNPVQTLPISAAALREVDILGTFRYANTYPEAIRLIAREKSLPDLRKLVTQKYHGLENAEHAFEMAGRTNDEIGALVLKVVLETGGDLESDNS